MARTINNCSVSGRKKKGKNNNNNFHQLDGKKALDWIKPVSDYARLKSDQSGRGNFSFASDWPLSVCFFFLDRKNKNWHWPIRNQTKKMPRIAQDRSKTKGQKFVRFNQFQMQQIMFAWSIETKTSFWSQPNYSSHFVDRMLDSNFATVR